MEEIVEKYKQWLQALSTFEKSIILYAKVIKNPKKWDQDEGDDVVTGLRDSVIKRFEYCYELTWKYVSRYLTQQGLDSAEKSPKSIFRQAGLVEILTQFEVEEAIGMCNARNTTSHIYKDEYADYLVKIIPIYYELMMKIAGKTKVQ